MSGIISYVALALLVAAVGWLEVPGMLRRGETRELWVFVGLGVAALTLLVLVTASVTFSPVSEAVVMAVKPHLEPFLQPPAE